MRRAQPEEVRCFKCGDREEVAYEKSMSMVFCPRCRGKYMLSFTTALDLLNDMHVQHKWKVPKNWEPEIEEDDDYVQELDFN